MSVKKGERKPSSNEALHTAHQIKNELMSYIFTDFGLEVAKARSYPQEFLNFICLTKSDLMRDVRDMTSRISSADCCKVVTEVDLKYRRNQLLKAISDCYKLEQSCMALIETANNQRIDININKYYRLTQLIITEIDLLRSLKNKDLQRFRKLKLNQEKQGIYVPVG